MTGCRVKILKMTRWPVTIMRGLCNLNKCMALEVGQKKKERKGIYHSTGAARVLQVGVEELGGSILECFGQSSKKHGEFRRVQLKERDQHHLGSLHNTTHTIRSTTHSLNQAN